MFRIPARHAPVLFSLILSGLMSLVISGVSTLRAAGLSPGFAGHWLVGWASSWPIAFPVVLMLAPLVRRIVARLCVLPAG
ncbi:DUF2798 domain-containing protein [Pleomorphomonas koreensis]|uniref:DUF2798 domain-containing protein n=1 Tax=Pleomorphomonas koreensis TaxID=257440 RepID=UPI00040CAA4C|nr:DUF2798 domain-containing protein [Pleomorphomonas koreensis]